MLQYQIIPVTPFVQNCSLLWCNQTRLAAVVDPGGDEGKITAALKQHSLTLQKVILTHGHVDHVGGVASLVRDFDVPIEGPHSADAFWIDQLEQQCQVFGLPRYASFQTDRWLIGGDTIKIGKETLSVLYTPGHTPGHVCFFHSPLRLAWVGDVLFAGSIGRTDFPQGDHATLVRSIREQLWPLGSDVQFIPGHGPMSTFGEERQSNPFVADGL